jgi:predicted ATPase
MYQAYATITRGWALIEQGLEEVAVKEMCEGLAALQATGNEVARPRFLALLAEALGKAGRHEEALGALAEALDLAQSKGGKCYLAELCRLKGELLLMQAKVGGLSRAAMPGKAVVGQTPAFAQAEACFHQSITIAKQQRARSWELRATVSLARLYQEQSKLQEARDLLAHVYDGFTEGFDTADLREAKRLLDELS